MRRIRLNGSARTGCPLASDLRQGHGSRPALQRCSAGEAIGGSAVLLVAVALLVTVPSTSADIADGELRNRFATVQAGPDTSEMRIETSTGGGADIKRVAVMRTAETVRVTVIQTDPSDPQTTQATDFCLQVRIGERLGNRRVTDGARQFRPGSRPPDRLRRERDRDAWGARSECRPIPANFYGED